MFHETPALISCEVERAVPVAASGAGWAVDPASIPQTLAALGELSEQEWDRYGSAARELAGKYTWDVAASQYEEAYWKQLDTR